MKIVIAFFALVTIAVAAPANPDADAVILRQVNDNIGVDGFNWAYETSNGISHQEQGQVNNAGTDNEAISVRGEYQYTGPDGVLYRITYIADENGFQPSGAHLPVAEV